MSKAFSASIYPGEPLCLCDAPRRPASVGPGQGGRAPSHCMNPPRAAIATTCQLLCHSLIGLSAGVPPCPLHNATWTSPSSARTSAQLTGMRKHQSFTRNKWELAVYIWFICELIKTQSYLFAKIYQDVKHAKKGAGSKTLNSMLNS